MISAQERDTFHALNNHLTPLQEHRYRIQLAKLLLQQANELPHHLSQINPDDLTELMLEYQETANHLNTFLNAALPHLDPEFKGQPFEQQLIELKQKIDTTEKNIERIHIQITELNQQSHILQEKNKTFDELEKTVSTLKKDIQLLSEKLTEISRYESELPNLKNRTLEMQQQTYEKLQKLFEETQKLVASTQNNYRIHFKENAFLSQAMQEVNAINPSQLTQLMEIEKQINILLQDSDKLLKAAISSS